MKNLRKKIYNQKGITLIVLVITIIVLLILAGVSIAMLTGENGILTQAQIAKEQTEQAAQNEAAILDEYNSILNNWINKGTVSIPEGLKIGSEIRYNPSGTYLWQSQYCGTPENTSNQKNLNSGDGQPFNINTWKVFDINEITGEIRLVPEHSTFDFNTGGGMVSLRGEQGYNNAVKLLNDACSALYGNENKKIKARSINIEDIEEKMTPEALQQAHNCSNSAAKWGEQVSSAYSQSNSYYPSLYAQESLREINGTYNSTGLGMNEQTSLVEPTDSYLQGTSIRPTQTSWNNDYNFTRTAFETKDGVNYYDLLIPNDIGIYWVASRFVYTRLGNCDFLVKYMYVGGTMVDGSIYSSDNLIHDGATVSLFPVVSLSSKLISGDATSGFVVE